MSRTNVEWVAQVSKSRPGPPTQSLQVALCFREKRTTEAFTPVLTGVMRGQAPIDILYENSALSYRVSIGIAG